MTLPFSRNTTYALLSQVKSVDLNALQDMIIGARHGYYFKQVALTQHFAIGGTGIAVTSLGQLSIPSTATYAGVFVESPVGALINKVRIRATSGDGRFRLSLQRRTDTTVTTVATADFDLGANTTDWAELTPPLAGLPHTVALNQVMFVEIGNVLPDATATGELLMIDSLEVEVAR